MDNAQKAIMIGVGLFITIIVIAAVMLITGMGQDLLNSGTQQLTNVSSQLQSQLTQDYDNKTMTGAQVLAAVKKYYNQTDMAIEVLNQAGSVNVKQAGGLTATTGSTLGANNRYSANDVSTTSSITGISEFSDKTKVASYIVTTAKYTSNLIEVNGAVVGIRFTKK